MNTGERSPAHTGKHKRGLLNSTAKGRKGVGSAPFQSPPWSWVKQHPDDKPTGCKTWLNSQAISLLTRGPVFFFYELFADLGQKLTKTSTKVRGSGKRIKTFYLFASSVSQCVGLARFLLSLFLSLCPFSENKLGETTDKKLDV